MSLTCVQRAGSLFLKYAGWIQAACWHWSWTWANLLAISKHSFFMGFQYYLLVHLGFLRSSRTDLLSLEGLKWKVKQLCKFFQKVHKIFKNSIFLTNKKVCNIRKQCKYFSRKIREMKRPEHGIWEMLLMLLIMATRRANGETATLLVTALY